MPRIRIIKMFIDHPDCSCSLCRMNRRLHPEGFKIDCVASGLVDPADRWRKLRAVTASHR